MSAGDPFYADVGAVFTDLDGTLTTAGQLHASTTRALERLAAAGVDLVIVTGRPSAWGEVLLRLLPLRAVVTENGGVTWSRAPDGRLVRTLALPTATLPALRRRMFTAARAALALFPGARLSEDSAGRVVDLAIDWNEAARLPEATARACEQFLRARGFRAVRSSVHVNFWPAGFDKLTASRKLARRLLGAAGEGACLYVGDALNDEPMFRGFPRSVGVASVRAVWDELIHRPSRVTRADGGRGFEAVARAVLAARTRQL